MNQGYRKPLVWDRGFGAARVGRVVLGVVVALGMLIAGSRAFGGPGAAEDTGVRAESPYSFTLSPRAVAEVAALDAEQLVEDEFFLATLRRLLDDEGWTAAERVDAFYLMQRKIGMGFTGWADLPPRWGYGDVFWRRADIFDAYRAALSDLEIDGRAYVAVARDSYREHPVRMGNALLLTALLDRRATQGVLDILTDPHRLAGSPVPPIAVHYLALSAAVSGDRRRVAALGPLLAEVPFEESREDLIYALAYRTAGPEVLAVFEAHVAASAQRGFDLSTGAALTALHRQLDHDDYRQAHMRAMAASDDEAWRAAVNRFRDGPAPRGGMGEPPGTPPGESVWLFKIWDGFLATVSDDGTVVRWGDGFFDTDTD